MIKRIVTVAVSLLLPMMLDGSVVAEQPRAGKLSFGWATESIVPGRPVAIGGQYNTRISGEVHDPITATALAIETRDDQGTIEQAIAAMPSKYGFHG